MIKNGTRLRSQVCDAQVIVVRSADSLDDLRCGGQPMLAFDAENSAHATLHICLIITSFTSGGAEVLVTKAGAGTLSIGSTALTLKEAKPLPASD